MLWMILLMVGAHAAGLQTSGQPLPHAGATGTGDINGDGYDDIVWGNAAGGTWSVTLALGSASGASTSTTVLDSGTAAGLVGVYITGMPGDIDGDGNSEVIVRIGTRDGSTWESELKILSYTAGGAASVLYEGDGIAVPLGDINDDGKADLAIRRDGAARFTLMLGAATPTLSTADLGEGVFGLGDIDGDGIDDLTNRTWSPETGTVVTLWAGGSGGLTELQSGFAGEPIGVGDVNGDGHGDVRYRYNQICYGHAKGIDVSVGACTITSWNRLSAQVHFPDVDGDGFADLLVPADTGDQVRLFLGGDPLDTVEDEARPNARPAGDINGDGLDDIISRRGGSAVLYLGDDGHLDGDGDGFGSGRDCDDDDPLVHPGADETPGDGIDQDCDGLELCYRDGDEDSYRSDTSLLSEHLDCAGRGLVPDTPLDCDDADPDVHPGAEEAPADGVDQDCDRYELCFADADEDGAGVLDSTVKSLDLTCQAAGAWDGEGEVDCDDGDAQRFPGADDPPDDLIDQDCNGVDACYLDEDGDGARGEAVGQGTEEGCAEPRADVDCDDEDPSISPGATEIPGDGIDQDCDGEDPTASDEQAGPQSGGCGCTASGSSRAGWLMPLLAVFLAGLRRRGRPGA